MSSLEGKGNGVNGLMSVGTDFRLLHVAGLERRESPSDQVRGRPQTSLRPLPSGRGNRCPIVQSVLTNNRKVRFGRVLRGSRAAPCIGMQCTNLPNWRGACLWHAYRTVMRSRSDSKMPTPMPSTSMISAGSLKPPPC